MFVKIPTGTLDIEKFATEELGFDKIALYHKNKQIRGNGLPVNLRAHIEGLVELVSTPGNNNPRIEDKFVKKFIVYYSNGSLQTLKIITSEKELEQVLDCEQLVQRVPFLMLATADQLKGQTTPISIDDFLLKREAHEKATANKERLREELKKEMINARANKIANIAENGFVKDFTACLC